MPGFVTVPYDDLAALEEELKVGGVEIYMPFILDQFYYQQITYLWNELFKLFIFKITSFPLYLLISHKLDKNVYVINY